MKCLSGNFDESQIILLKDFVYFILYFREGKGNVGPGEDPTILVYLVKIKGKKFTWRFRDLVPDESFSYHIQCKH